MGITNSLSFRMLRLGVVGLATLLFMTSTSPARLPALLLVAPFFGIFAFLFLFLLEVTRFLGSGGDGDGSAGTLKLRRPRLLAAVLAGFPVLLLVLQSIVELTLRDSIIAFAIMLLAYLYILRSSISFWRR